MNTRKTSCITLLLIILSAPISTIAADGFYIGASIGSASLDDEFDGLQVDDDTKAYRLVGGWRFNRNVAVEVGIQSFGDFEQDFNINGQPVRARLSADGFTLGVQGDLPLAEKLSVFGRFGAFFWSGDAEVIGVSQASPNDVNPYIGLGLSYNFSDRFSANFDMTKYELESTNSDVLALGFRYQFGN